MCVVGRFDSSAKGEIFKLTIKDVDFGDMGEYSLEIGERHTRANLEVVPCKYMYCTVTLNTQH
jgi:hypothetical protein